MKRKVNVTRMDWTLEFKRWRPIENMNFMEFHQLFPKLEREKEGGRGRDRD
jgi:hypothetical protein